MTTHYQTIRKLKEKVAKEEAIAIESVEVLEKELMKIKPPCSRIIWDDSKFKRLSNSKGTYNRIRNNHSYHVVSYN